MSRTAAIAVLSGFGLLGLIGTVLGIVAVLGWRAEIGRCTSPLTLDTAYVWYTAGLAVAALPLLALLETHRAHRILFLVAIAWFVGAPFLARLAVTSAAQAQGYDASPIASPFQVGERTLTHTGCTPSGI